MSARERGPKGRVPRSDWCTLFAGSFLLLVHCERWQWKQLQHPDLMGRPKSKPRRQGRNINVWTSFSSPEENYFNFLTSSKCAADARRRRDAEDDANNGPSIDCPNAILDDHDHDLDDQTDESRDWTSMVGFV